MELKALNKQKINLKKQLTYIQTVRVPQTTQTLLYKNSSNWVIRVIGSMGVLNYKIKKNEIGITRRNKNSFIFFGTKRSVRTQIRNLGYLLIGVNRPFTTSLEVRGVGFKFFGISPCIRAELGQTHPIFYCCRNILRVHAYKRNTRLYFKSIDFKQLFWLVGHIRNITPPGLYTGKGIRYLNEFVKIKKGKKGNR